MAELLLDMRSITKTFPGVRALDHVSFQLRPGEIHALVGENGAGKSTLIKILGGVYQADEGEILIDGKEVQIRKPIEAIRLGVSIIYQEFNLVPTLSIAENIFLGSEITRGKRKALNRNAMYEEARRYLKSLDMENLDVRLNVGRLSVAGQQLVEIAKALKNNSRILVMDEPTAVLTQREAEAMFKVMRMLRDRGIGIIFISHRLEEVQAMADRITVFRDGQVVTSLDNQDRSISKDVIVEHMVGRSLTDYYPPRDETVSPGETVLEVKNLSSGERFRDVSFAVRKGEILGLSGLIGAGRTEVGMTIFGAYEKTGGQIRLDGKEISINRVTDAIRAGITLVPEDRKGTGLVLMMNMEDNIALPNADLISSHGTIRSEKREKLARKYIEELSIHPALPKRSISDFSGGNQQKVVIAKWLARLPKVLIMDEPTRGVDVGAKREIYLLMRGLTARGVSIVFISSEMPELLGMCDRILVMHEGRMTGSFKREEFDQHRIMRAAAGLEEKEQDVL